MDLTIIGYFVCTFIGILAGAYITLMKPDGELKIDMTDPNKDKYSLEFHTPLDDVPKKGRVIFKVVTITTSNP